MRKGTLFLALALIGCSKAENSGGGEQMNDVTQQANNGRQGPNVAPTAMAGVAMTYAYAFILPVQQVAATQEKHAAQCEALGPARCRVTGMKYHTQRGRSIYAELSLKLAPELARKFGKQATDSVVAVGGMLADAGIDSSDEGAMIASAQQNDASLAAEQNDVAAQLQRSGMGANERSQLQAHEAELRERRRALSAAKADSALKLASTPMTFNYLSGEVDPGFNDGPWLSALKDGWANLMSGLRLLLTVVITVLPWAILLGLCIWIWRRFAQRLGASRKDEG